MRTDDQWIADQIEERERVGMWNFDNRDDTARVQVPDTAKNGALENFDTASVLIDLLNRDTLAAANTLRGFSIDQMEQIAAVNCAIHEALRNEITRRITEGGSK
jgi:hypothetical protein